MSCIINSNRILYTCISAITYLYGLFWLVMSLIISTNMTDSGKIGFNTKLLIKKMPSDSLTYVLLSFSLANIANGVFGCMFMEIIITANIKYKPTLYKRFITISNIYIITMGSIYLTWMLILFQLLLYISTIYYINKLVKSEAKTHVVVSIPNSSNNIIPTGIITAEPYIDNDKDNGNDNISLIV